MATVIVKSRDSLLTTSSGYTNYRGILNLVIILLVLSNARVALENVIKYGILVDPLSWLLFLGQGSKHCPALVIVLIQAAHILISLLVEKLIASKLSEPPKNRAAKQKPARPDRALSTSEIENSADKWVQCQQEKSPKERILAEPVSAQQVLAHAVIVTNLFACLSLPPVIIYSHDTHPISTSVSLMLVSIVFLKLVSYHMINFWCRDIKLCRQDERQYARTTKSFLSSYTPPAIEFGDTKKFAQPQEPVKAGSESENAIRTPNGLASISSSSSNNNNNNINNNNHIARPEQTESPKASRSLSRGLTREAALKTLARYPSNLNLRDISNYMLFPTLCYEVQFARTERLRKRFLIKRIVELLILSQLDLALVQQWIVPTVSNSMLPLRQMQFSYMLERLLKLAVPNHVIWLIWFYLFFHSLLNIAAELTRFADREFYRDWWNSESVYYFWSNWNIPVHKWCARHLYVPLISLGFNKCQASTAVFFVSAFFHEYLVSVPLKLFRMWAFTGMLIQLPWARFVSSYFNSHFANVAVWVSLIIGQPLCILMYYHDYYVINSIKSSSLSSAGPALG